MMIDWCEKASKLRERYEALRDGEGLSEARFGEDNVKYTKADMGLLLADLREAERLCAEQQGVRPRRRRFAATGRMRPY
ncbi:hypothetical protein [Pseudochelatococcus sp. G4_1912]|uniref:hypothetical protein n=1 Tax=Pseudochelatococcus sp. G4_1912 TaxID=3114288 RepID=UPI0039C5D5D8